MPFRHLHESVLGCREIYLLRKLSPHCKILFAISIWSGSQTSHRKCHLRCRLCIHPEWSVYKYICHSGKPRQTEKGRHPRRRNYFIHFFGDFSLHFFFFFYAYIVSSVLSEHTNAFFIFHSAMICQLSLSSA